MWWDHPGWVIAERFAIEDLASRSQVEKYYFKHSSSAAENLGISREYLWPRDADFFLMVTKSLLFSAANIGTLYPNTGYFLTRIPNRPDLVDSGYAQEESTPKGA